MVVVKQFPLLRLFWKRWRVRSLFCAFKSLAKGNVRLEQYELNYLYNKMTMYAMNRGNHLSEIIHNTSRAEQGLWILSPLCDSVVTAQGDLYTASTNEGGMIAVTNKSFSVHWLVNIGLRPT